MGQFVDAVVVDDLICWFKFFKRCEAFTRMLYYDFGDFHIFNYENASWKVFTVWIVLFSAHPSYLFNLMMFGWGHFFHESLSFYVEFHIWVCVFFLIYAEKQVKSRAIQDYCKMSTNSKLNMNDKISSAFFFSKNSNHENLLFSNVKRILIEVLT